MIQATDLRITCRDCGREFTFTEGEQNFYEQMGFTPPTRCRQCRVTKDKQSYQVACSECGREIHKDSVVYCQSCSDSAPSGSHVTCAHCGVEQEKSASVYCDTCLNKMRLDSDRKSEKLKRSLSATQSKLQMVESQNEDLQKSLYETKRYANDLELKLQNMGQDLEKAYKFYVASNWLKPTLDNVARRLESLERSGRETNREVSTTMRKVQEFNESINFWEVLKRSFKLHRNGHKTLV